MKNYSDFVESSFLAGSELLVKCTALKEEIAAASLLFTDCLKNGGKVLAAGNGGSASDAQHFAAELIVRFTHNRASLPAVSLCVDPSVVTAIGNDFGFEDIFSRQLDGLGQPGDTLLAISTSGRSKNVIEAAKKAKGLGVKVVSLMGSSVTELNALSDVSINVPSTNTARVQEVHSVVLHILCGLIEEQLGL